MGRIAKKQRKSTAHTFNKEFKSSGITGIKEDVNDDVDIKYHDDDDKHHFVVTLRN